MTPREHTITVSNPLNPTEKHAVHFLDWGNVESQNVVVCVHGMTRNARDFDIIAQALAEKGRRVFSISMPGRGMSEWLADPFQYNYATYVTDCLAVIDSFHIRTVDWIGTSMGGIIGMIVAAKFSTRIRKLVLNDVGIHLPAEALERIYTYLRNMPKEFLTREAADRYLARIFEPFGIRDPGHWNAFVDHSLLREGTKFKLACDPAIVEVFRRDTNNFTDIAAVNLSEFWEAVRQPTFILWGETSDLLNAEIVRSMKATHPRAESLMVPNVGHAPALMTDDQIRPIINFLIPQGLGI